MMKRLLLMAFAAMSAASSFALSEGEFVYTPQGRFQITGANAAACDFNDPNFTGWTVITGSEKTITDLFNQNANGYAEGLNSIQSKEATAGEGMYFKFSPSSADAIYVVSFKMKGAANLSTRIATPAIATDLVKVEGNADGAFGGETDVLVCNTAEELTENWQTFNYAIGTDGVARDYYISFSGMNTSIEIADLQIAPAAQYADLRQRDAMLDLMKAYTSVYDWSADLLAEYAVTETIEGLQAIGDESAQSELDEQINVAKEVIAEFLKNNMDDYLAGGNRDNYFDTWRTKMQKWEKIGDWTCLPSKRGFWENASQGCVDLGHFNGNKWNNGDPTSPMGVYMQKELSAGSYVFTIESKANVREANNHSSWAINDGLKPAYGVAYIVKIVDGAAADTIASVVKELPALNRTTFIVPAKIAEDGTYEIGFKSFCKESCQDLAQGSVTYVANASLWGKNDNKYNQKQLGYEADVREQITTGRTQLTTAAEYIANADYLWGKDELKACVDTVEVKIAEFEKLDQDAIIATYDEYDGDYSKTTSSEEGILVYQVYQAAVKDIIAANKKFVAVNDTLNSMQTVIDNAEYTLGLRVYSSVTDADKNTLTSAIDAAKATQTKMKTVDYTEDNAKIVTATNDALNEAIATFKNSIPAASIASVLDIDFENDAVLNEETQLYSVTGAVGAMEFSRFSTADVPVDGAFEQGFWSNGEQQWKGYVRVGNGMGTALFDAGEMGTSILRINCDFFLQGLSNRNVGFYLTNDADSVVTGFYANYYNNTIDGTYSTLPIDLGSLKYASGGSYDNGSPEGAEPATANPLAKNSFEVIMDFGEGSIYCNTTSAKGVVTTEKQEFDKTVPTKFILRSNYDDKFASRRCWFDNLKIERIAAGATDPFISGIREVNEAAKVKAPTKVFKNGRIIINGKYGINGMLIK